MFPFVVQMRSCHAIKSASLYYNIFFSCDINHFMLVPVLHLKYHLSGMKLNMKPAKEHIKTTCW